MDRKLAPVYALTAAAAFSYSLWAFATSEPRGRAARLPSGECIAVTVLHREKSVDVDGVTRHVEYRERLLRCEGRVWIERLLAPGRQAPGDAAENAHPELPPAHELAKLIGRSDDGHTTLTLVHPGRRIAIDVPAEEFDSVGFDGNWEAANHLLRPETLRGLRPARGSSHAPGAKWLERRERGRYVRVLWSDALGLPLEIASGTDDGRVSDELRIRVDPLEPSALPWKSLQGFTRRDLGAYRD